MTLSYESIFFLRDGSNDSIEVFVLDFVENLDSLVHYECVFTSDTKVIVWILENMKERPYQHVQMIV